MKKQTVLIFLIVLVFVTFASYFMFSSGLTDKLKGQINEFSADNGYQRYTSDLPIITMVFNSSGEKLVNDDVGITINAESNSNITKVEYSFDLNSWKNIKDTFNSKTVDTKITFNKTMNEEVYIRVTNERGYKSYAYKTIVKIDKDKPVIKITSNNVIASDNVGISYIQGSNDKLNWDVITNDDNISINNKNISYKYLRAVDLVGNISEVQKIND